MATQAHVNPLLLNWARNRAGLTQQTIATSLSTKPSQVEAWEAGDRLPTFQQAIKWASVTHVPFGFLFLQEPPEENLPLPDLRTLGSHAPNRPSVDLLDTVRDVLSKQNWYLEYAQQQEYEPLKFVGRFTTSSTIADIVADMRTHLRLGVDVRAAGKDEYFRDLVKAIEAIGVLVMRSGYVGTNTHRKLDVGEFRGFAVSDAMVPVIFINSADAPAARLFTLLHELAHIWIGQSGISDAAPQNTRTEEKFCNAVAGEFLVPQDDFLRLWNKKADWQTNLATLAQHFHVSRLVIARRAADLGIVDRGVYVQHYLAELEAFRHAESIGGSYYRNAYAKNSIRFSQAVVSEAMSGRLMLREAGKLLGVQPSKIKTYAEKLAG